MARSIQLHEPIHTALQVTYGEYLRLEQLLKLQEPPSEGPQGPQGPGVPEHDEMLFIIIHQVYELWFKEILHELDYARGLLGTADSPRVAHTLKRILTILKVLVAQLDILETMTPLEFLSFRERLDTASGFQSNQFRELEFALGRKHPAHMERFPEGSAERAALDRRYTDTTLWDDFLRFLQRAGYDIPEEVLGRDVTQSVEPSEAVQDVLMDIYRNDRGVAQLCELLVDLDEGIQEWRYRHVKMVERTIGNKAGTGGSTGVGYLTATLGKPVFPDLWAIRTRL